MNKHRLQQTFLIFLTGLLLPVSLWAQRGPLRNSRFYKGQSNYGIMRVSVGTGTTTYYGDLCESGDCLRARPQFNVGFNYRFTGRVSAKAELSYLRLYSTDKGGINARRNLSFRSGNPELYVAGVVDIFRYNKIYNRRELIRPYAFAGFGLTYISPRAELNGKWYGLPQLNTEGVDYSRFVPVIPYGGGVSFKVNPYLDFSVEIGYRLSFSDYIDDVSTTFIRNSSLDPIGAALADRSFEAGVKPYNTDDGIHWREGHKRGNPSRNDGYVNIGFKLDYTINPVIRPKLNVLGKPRKPRYAKNKRIGVSGKQKRR
jgi:hypothetical protein